jgi:hypothetical protein
MNRVVDGVLRRDVPAQIASTAAPASHARGRGTLGRVWDPGGPADPGDELAGGPWFAVADDERFAVDASACVDGCDEGRRGVVDVGRVD